MGRYETFKAICFGVGVFFLLLGFAAMGVNAALVLYMILGGGR